MRDVLDHQTQAADRIASYDEMLSLTGAGRAGQGRHAAEHRHAQDLGVGGDRRGADDDRRHLRDELRAHARTALGVGLSRGAAVDGGASAASCTAPSAATTGCSGASRRASSGRRRGRFGSSTSTPSSRQACRIASAPLSRTHAASVGGDRHRRQEHHRVTAAQAARRSAIVDCAQQHRGERRRLPQRRADRSTSASGTSTTPSTAGVAATTASDAGQPGVGVGPRRLTTTSARGPRTGSAATRGGIGHRVSRTAQRDIVSDAVGDRGRTAAPRCARRRGRSRWPRRARRRSRRRRSARAGGRGPRPRTLAHVRRRAGWSGSLRCRRRRSCSLAVSSASSTDCPLAHLRLGGNPCHELVFADTGLGGQLGELGRAARRRRRWRSRRTCRRPATRPGRPSPRRSAPGSAA